MKQDDSQGISGKQVLAAAALYAAVLIILFHRVVFSGYMLLPLDLVHEAITPWASPDTELDVKTHYTSDSIVEFYPIAHYAYRGLKDEGRLPLWISSVSGGRPLLGDSVHAFLNPFNILWLFMPFDAAWNYRLLGQLLFAGFFMYLFVRGIGIGYVGGLFSGLCYMLNSMFVVLLLRSFILGGFVWVPLLLLFLDRFLRTGRRTDSACFGLMLAACLLGGSLQTSIYVCISVAVFYFFRHRSHSCTGPNVPTGVTLQLAIAVCLGFGIAAIFLLPSLELILLNQRQLGRINTQWSLLNAMLTVPLWISFVFPRLVGSHDTFDLTRIIGTNLATFQGYTGFVSIICCFYAIRYVRHRLKPALLVLGLVALLISLTPWVRIVYYRIYILFAFAVSVLGGMGLSRMADCLGDAKLKAYVRKVGILVVGYFLVLALSTAAVAIYGGPIRSRIKAEVTSRAKVSFYGYYKDWYERRADRFLEDFNLSKSRTYIPLAIVLGSWASLAVFGSLRGRKAAFLAVLFALSILDLGYFALSYIPVCDPKMYPPYPDRPSIRMLQNDRDVFRVLRLNMVGVERPLAPRFMFVPYNVNTLLRVGSVFPKTPALLLMHVLKHRDFLAQVFEKSNLRPYGCKGIRDLVNLLNVKYIVTDSQRELKEQDVTLVYDGEVRIYRNNHFLPRAFLVYEYRVLSSDSDVVASILAGELNPERETLLQKEPAIPIGPGPAAASRVDILSYEDNKLVLEVESSRNGVLVVSDTFYPGWKAFVDDAPTEILKALGVMKAVAIPAGKHIVRFVYDPLSFKSGVLVTVISSITFLAYFLVSLLGQRRPSGQHR